MAFNFTEPQAQNTELWGTKKGLATCYFPTHLCSIIAAEALNRRVRDGNGCYVLAKVTSPKNGRLHRKEKRVICPDRVVG